MRLRLLRFRFWALMLLASPLWVSCSRSHGAVYSTADAKNHVGEIGSVVGVVEQVSLSRRGTQFLNFDGEYPDAPFTAVVFQADAAAVGDVMKYNGKRTVVTGKITVYRGTPEIIVRTRNALAPE